MKKTAVAALAAFICLMAFGKLMPHISVHRGPAPRPAPQIHRGPAPRPAPMPHRHNHYSTWGRGGSNFWPGFAGGVIGSAILRPPALILPPPPPRPHVFAVWVEPVVEMRPVYDVYGNIIRYDQVVIRAGYWL